MTTNLPIPPIAEPCNRLTEPHRSGLAEFGPMPTPRHAIALLVCVAVLALGASPAAAERTPGIDVSRFNGDIAWEQVGASEVEFAFVAASRGSGEDCAVAPTRCGADPLYDGNYAGAKAAGIRVGPYHRAFTNGNGRRGVRKDARAEARTFLDSVGDLSADDLPPALDVEAPFDGLDPRELRRWIRIWLKRVERRLGRKPIVYTNASSWGQTGDTLSFASRGHRLWVANWNVRTPIVPADDWAGESWTIWQYTSSGSVPGISGRVDRNWLRGGFEAISVG
jgi:GH25 family lysozyme M1 (1,4-beta-N-acetylmuramidase)